MAEKACPVIPLCFRLLDKYASVVGGGKTSLIVKERLKKGGMAEALMTYAEICDASGLKSATEMGLENNWKAVDFLSYVYLLSGPILFGLALMGNTGLKLASRLGEIQIKLPGASCPTGADWIWAGSLDHQQHQDGMVGDNTGVTHAVTRSIFSTEPIPKSMNQPCDTKKK